MSDPAPSIIGTTRDQENLSKAEYGVYANTEHGDCGYYCFKPQNPIKNAAGKTPAVIFFHGGMFDQRLSAQFAPHCLHFANRGMMAFSVEYRVSTKHGTNAMDSLQDARMFMDFLNQNQDFFGIDIKQVVVGGSASGGMLALHLALRHKHTIQHVHQLPRPIACILYSPLTNATQKGIGLECFPSKGDAKKMSPVEHCAKGDPALILFHGKADTTIPFQHSEKLFKKWKSKSKNAELVDFQTARHIDFNLNVNPEFYEQALRSADNFLTDLEILPPDPDAFLD